MAETYFIRDLLLPELDTEIGKTRRLFEALPDSQSDFKPYEKSMTLGRLAGYTTDFFGLMAFTLTLRTRYGCRLATLYHDPQRANAQALREQRQRRSEVFQAKFGRGLPPALDYQAWSEHSFSGGRFTYHRNQGIIQIVHHRAQLGTYLRALALPMPGMYGTSADGI